MIDTRKTIKETTHIKAIERQNNRQIILNGTVTTIKIEEKTINSNLIAPLKFPSLKQVSKTVMTKNREKTNKNRVLGFLTLINNALRKFLSILRYGKFARKRQRHEINKARYKIATKRLEKENSVAE